MNNLFDTLNSYLKDRSDLKCERPTENKPVDALSLVDKTSMWVTCNIQYPKQKSSLSGVAKEYENESKKYATLNSFVETLVADIEKNTGEKPISFQKAKYYREGYDQPTIL